MASSDGLDEPKPTPKPEYVFRKEGKSSPGSDSPSDKPADKASNLEKGVDGTGTTDTAPRAYTLPTTKQRYCIVLLIGTATMFSPLTANIYLPCIPLLQKEFDVSLQLINTTVTAYVLVQSISPAFFSPLADTIGRRPVYLTCFTISTCASIGLALQGDYAALLGLRMLQSVGSSVSTSLGSAVVADIAAPAERGKLLGPVLLLINLGPVISPVIGGPLCHAAGWRWLFWLLTILGFVFLAIMMLFLPETNRNIVRNGIVHAPGINRPVFPSLIPKAAAYDERVKKIYMSRWAKIRALAPNPFKPIYAAYYILQASLAPLFAQAYGYNESELGLFYLAISVGVIFGSQIQSKVLDWNYRVTARSIDWDIDHLSGDDLSRFPIERARARLAWLSTTIQCACMLTYGWGLHFRLHPAMPLVFIFMEGCFGWMNAWNTLLTDTHRKSTATASAASSLVRGLMAAGGVAVMEPLYKLIGLGPFFSLLAGVMFVFGQVLIWAIRTKGVGWRLKRGVKGV